MRWRARRCLQKPGKGVLCCLQHELRRGEQEDEDPEDWTAKMLTRDHKPECEIELARIEASGGKVGGNSRGLYIFNNKYFYR